MIKKSHIKNIIIFLSLTIVIYMNYTCIKFIIKETKTEVYAGTIMNMSSFINNGGKYIYTNHTILVNFDKIGYVSLDISEGSFLRYKIGDRVYYEFSDSEAKNNGVAPTNILMTINMILCIIIDFIILVFFICNLVDFFYNLYNKLND